MLTTHPLTLPEGDARRTSSRPTSTTPRRATWPTAATASTAPPGASPFDYRTFQDVIEPTIDRAEGKGCASVGCHADRRRRHDADLVAGARQRRDGGQLHRGHVAHQPGAPGLVDRVPARHHPARRWPVGADGQGGAGRAARLDRGGGRQLRRAERRLRRSQPLRLRRLPRRDPADPARRHRPQRHRQRPAPAPAAPAAPATAPTDRPPARSSCSTPPRPRTTCTTSPASSTRSARRARRRSCARSNDPRCRRYPHPGDDVLDGVDDLNYQRLLVVPLRHPVRRSAARLRLLRPAHQPDLQRPRTRCEDGAQGRTCADTRQLPRRLGRRPAAAQRLQLPDPRQRDATRPPDLQLRRGGQLRQLRQAGGELAVPLPDQRDRQPRRSPVRHRPAASGRRSTSRSTRSRPATILTWAGGLRPDADGFVRNWLVAGDFPLDPITDPTPIDEATAQPDHLRPAARRSSTAASGTACSPTRPTVDLASAFPRAAASRPRRLRGRLRDQHRADRTIRAQLTVTSPNADPRLRRRRAWSAERDGGTVIGAGRPAVATGVEPHARPASSSRCCSGPTTAGSRSRRASATRLGNPFTDRRGEIVVKLGPKGGI